MKRVIWLLAACALSSLCGLLPWKYSDAADLIPVETLLVDYRDGRVCLAGEDGLFGTGADLTAAMEDMRSRAPGNLFFGQVSRVVAGGRAATLLTAAAREGLLRLNTAIYSVPDAAAAFAEALPDLEPFWQAGETHGQLTTLLEFCADGKAPVALNKEGKQT